MFWSRAFNMYFNSNTIEVPQDIKTSDKFVCHVLNNLQKSEHCSRKVLICSLLKPWGGYSHTLPIRVCAAQWVVILKLLIQNGVSISGAFSRMGYNISNARKLQFCKQPFEINQGRIAFKNTVQCVNKQTVVFFTPQNGV